MTFKNTKLSTKLAVGFACPLVLMALMVELGSGLGLAIIWSVNRREPIPVIHNEKECSDTDLRDHTMRHSEMVHIGERKVHTAYPDADPEWSAERAVKAFLDANTLPVKGSRSGASDL